MTLLKHFSLYTLPDTLLLAVSFCVCVCGGQRLIPDVFLSCLSTIFFESVSLNLDVTDLVDWWASKPLASFCICLPSCGIAGMDLHFI